jgi:hypothetical protein
MTCGAPIVRPEPGSEIIGHSQISQAFRDKRSKLLENRYAEPPEPPARKPDAPPPPAKAEETPAICPFCGNKLAPESILCVACGRNLRSGRSLISRRRRPLILLGRFITAVLGLISFVATVLLCLIAIGVIIYGGSTFFKKEPAPETAGQAAPPAAVVPPAPVEPFEQILEVAAQPRAPITVSEHVKEMSAAPATAATNVEPDKVAANPAPLSTNTPEQQLQQDEIARVVNAILTSWKDRTPDSENYLAIGYSSGQLTSPLEWRTRAFEPDPKNPDLMLVTVFVKRINPSGKAMQANWTFKFRREDGAWKLVSWFE